MKFSSDEIAQYLCKHPQFFEEYADMLADIQVPHPHGGRAIPISERQIIALRDKNRILQEKLSDFDQIRRRERRIDRKNAPPGDRAAHIYTPE